MSESELQDLKVDELRERARKEGISGVSGMRREELVEALSKGRGKDRGEDGGNGGGSSDGASGAGEARDARPDAGHLRTGEETSRSLKYSQEVTSPDDDPERAGRSRATTSHEVIRQWAEERQAVPATVEGTEHGDHLGVLRFDFGGDSERLRHVGWEEWFDTFAARSLNFIYQEERKDGNQSNFFRLESPDREDG